MRHSRSGLSGVVSLPAMVAPVGAAWQAPTMHWHVLARRLRELTYGQDACAVRLKAVGGRGGLSGSRLRVLCRPQQISPEPVRPRPRLRCYVRGILADRTFSDAESRDRMLVIAAEYNRMASAESSATPRGPPPLKEAQRELRMRSVRANEQPVVFNYSRSQWLLIT
jgi:hypothetical protein